MRVISIYWLVCCSLIYLDEIIFFAIARTSKKGVAFQRTQNISIYNSKSI